MIVADIRQRYTKPKVGIRQKKNSRILVKYLFYYNFSNSQVQQKGGTLDIPEVIAPPRLTAIAIACQQRQKFGKNVKRLI